MVQCARGAVKKYALFYILFLYVVFLYFPEEKAVATGDLFMNRSCPAMDKGSVSNWIHTLAWMLTLPAAHYVPGHFELGTRKDVARFHAYLATLWKQVEAAYRAGVPIGELGSHLRLSAYSDFRQFPQYQATFLDNAKHAYGELEAAKKGATAKSGSGGRP